MIASGFDVSLLVLRLVVASIFVAQGWVKVLRPANAPHGRNALAQLIAYGGLPWPCALARAVGVSELVAGSLMGIGLLVRLVAIPLVGILVVAIARFKWRAGFIGGWDWPLAVLGSVVALLISGGGRYGADGLLGWTL
ncbi:MAG: DoxX family protein [Candidatus Dormiibacterota bacterium]